MMTREQHREWQRRYRAKHPEKYRAYYTLSNARRDGRLGDHLCSCGKLAEAHHDDYSQPFKITWLCRTCHKALHRGDGNQGRKGSYGKFFE
jgi:hypothetical protein